MTASCIYEGLNLQLLCVGVFPQTSHINASFLHLFLKRRPVGDGFVFQDFVDNLPDFYTAFLRTSEFGGVK